MKGYASFQEVVDIVDAIGFCLGLQTVLEKHSQMSPGDCKSMPSVPYSPFTNNYIDRLFKAGSSIAVNPGREITTKGSDAKILNGWSLFQMSSNF